MAKLKAYSGTFHARREWEAVHYDGRGAQQVRLAVLATSRAKVVEALNAIGVGRISVGYVRDWMYEDTGYQPLLDALAEHPPGTVLIGPLDMHDTVMGQDGFLALEPGGRIKKSPDPERQVEAVRGLAMLGGQDMTEDQKLDAFMGIFHPGRKL